MPRWACGPCRGRRGSSPESPARITNAVAPLRRTQRRDTARAARPPRGADTGALRQRPRRRYAAAHHPRARGLSTPTNPACARAPPAGRMRRVSGASPARRRPMHKIVKLFPRLERRPRRARSGQVLPRLPGKLGLRGAVPRIRGQPQRRQPHGRHLLARNPSPRRPQRRRALGPLPQAPRRALHQHRLLGRGHPWTRSAPPR